VDVEGDFSVETIHQSIVVSVCFHTNDSGLCSAFDMTVPQATGLLEDLRGAIDDAVLRPYEGSEEMA
jgi:hypothetical protein